MDKVKLTQYSHGAGCGCKIAPAVLEQILSNGSFPQNKPDSGKLLVGYNTKDDAAVYDIGGGKAIISTTDFFMPIVDDPFDFGRVASVNAISDVYAMGGNPIMAISVLGWPIDQLSSKVAAEVISGARQVCKEAGIQLAGGHSIDNPEPIFGLAVTGIIDIANLKKNSQAEPGCLLYLTKPLGVGVLATAQKKGLLQENHQHIARDWMVQLNHFGCEAAQLSNVKAMTDVTGFGLLGHLVELCEGSGVNALVEFNSVPQIEGIEAYISAGAIPGGTKRNWDSYGHKIQDLSEQKKMVLCDPQTSGGLLIAVKKEEEKEFLGKAKKHGLELQPIGETVERLKEGPYICVS